MPILGHTAIPSRTPPPYHTRMQSWMTFRDILSLQAAPPLLFLRGENFIVVAKQIPPIRSAVILARLIARLYCGWSSFHTFTSTRTEFIRLIILRLPSYMHRNAVGIFSNSIVMLAKVKLPWGCEVFRGPCYIVSADTGVLISPVRPSIEGKHVGAHQDP